MKRWLEFLGNFNYEQIYWLFEMGVPRRKGDIYDLREADFQILDPPVFFLSTGRCGTQWFAKFLKKDKNLGVFHAPSPDLAIQSMYAFQLGDSIYDTESRESLLVSELFLTGRENYLRYAYKTGKRYVETNNQISFFAPLLAGILPNSVFVHLYRHPGEFVRSGLRRGWYDAGDNKAKLKLIEPLPGSRFHNKWSKFNQLQKISWLWWETNNFIELFKKNYPGRVFDFNFNELSTESLEKFCEDLAIHINKRKMAGFIKKKHNVQTRGSYSEYDKWPEEDKDLLRDICGDLAASYGYRI